MTRSTRSRRPHRKLSRQAQKRVSSKIAVLRREGKSEREAAGVAYGMERSGRLRSGGRYVRKHGKTRKHTARGSVR